MSKYETYKEYITEFYTQNMNKMILICYSISNTPPPPIYNVQIGEVLS